MIELLYLFLSGRPQLPEANVLISLLSPSKLPPLALKQYNCLASKVDRNGQIQREVVTVVSFLGINTN